LILKSSTRNRLERLANLDALRFGGRAFTSGLVPIPEEPRRQEQSPGDSIDAGEMAGLLGDRRKRIGLSDLSISRWDNSALCALVFCAGFGCDLGSESLTNLGFRV